MPTTDTRPVCTCPVAAGFPHHVTPACQPSEPTIGATLACGDTVSVRTVPAIGAYRFCIHCDSRKRVTAVTDRSRHNQTRNDRLTDAETCMHGVPSPCGICDVPAEAERGQQEEGAHCPKHGPTAYAHGDDDFVSWTGFAGGSCYAARMECGCWDADESDDARAAQ